MSPKVCQLVAAVGSSPLSAPYPQSVRVFSVLMIEFVNVTMSKLTSVIWKDTEAERVGTARSEWFESNSSSPFMGEGTPCSSCMRRKWVGS